MKEQNLPDGFDPTTSGLFVYLYRLLIDSQDRELAGQLQKVRESQKAKEPHLRQQLEKYGVDFQKEIFPLVRNTLIPFLMVWALRKASSDIKRQADTLLKRYRLAYNMLTGPTAPFPGPLKAQLREHWAKMEKEKREVVKIADELAQEKLSLEARSNLPPLTKEFHKYRTWRLFELSLFRTLENRGISAQQTYGLIALCLKTYLPEGFTAKNRIDAIRLRLNRPTKGRHLTPSSPRK